MEKNKKGFTPHHFSGVEESKFQVYKKGAGFTLIELLVVIFIIGILSTVAIVATNNAREKSRQTVCQSGLRKISDSIEIWRDFQENLLIDITGSDCSACNCEPYSDEIFFTRECLDPISDAMDSIGYNYLMRDPWGDPFLIDENEYANPADPCIADVVFSLNCGQIEVPFYFCND